jgi:MYXO-CTERM domain-containing protein
MAWPLRLLFAALCALGAGLLSSLPAHAAGSVTISDRSPKEEDGRWKLKMTINYGGVPHLAHIPMLFEFTNTVHYERALTDQSPERPILNRIPLQNQQPINESMDVGFSDGSGKIFPITKFDFVLRRDRGFEAGEYDLKIKREGDGVQIGPTIKITLQGENQVIDRRAIVFSGEKKKAKKEEKAEEKKGGEGAAAGSSPEAAPSPAETPPDIPSSEPPSVPPKQGGCGCRLAGGDDAPGAPPVAALAALVGGALLVKRRAARKVAPPRAARA